MITEPQRRIYLDCNATAPMRPAVRDVVMAAMDCTGNASSVHAEGRGARTAIEAARRDVAALVGASPDRLVFTAGATEAAALALSPDLGRPGDPPASRLFLGATEHPAVRNGHRFPTTQVEILPVSRDGVLDLDCLASRLAAWPGRAIVALQAANGETGVIQPVAEAAALVHRAGGLLVCDAVQAAGRIPCGPEALGADAVILSAHKLGGPQGVGALALLREGIAPRMPVLGGGGQERGLRSGTENRPGIVGFGVAARLAAAEVGAGLALRERLEAQLRAIAPDLVLFGANASRLPNTVAFAVPGVASDTALMALDLAGFAVSTGAACASGKVSRSAVLEAMGVDDHLKGGMLRISLGWCSHDAEVDRFAEAFGTLMQRMRMRPARAAA